MNEQEFYIWLLNCNSKLLPEFDPEFLKNYEIAKLILDKFGIHGLNEEKQIRLNFEAVSNWFRVSKFIYLKYDIPEILELLPERIVGNLSLFNSEIKSLPKLKSTGDNLQLENSKIQSLPNLKSVGWYLSLINSEIKSLPQLETVGGRFSLSNSQIQSLPELESVGGTLSLRNTKIQSLPELESVGENLFLTNSQIQFLPKLDNVEEFIYVDKNKLNYWKRYFSETGRLHLIKRVTG